MSDLQAFTGGPSVIGLIRRFPVPLLVAGVSLVANVWMGLKRQSLGDEPFDPAVLACFFVATACTAFGERRGPGDATRHGLALGGAALTFALGTLGGLAEVELGLLLVASLLSAAIAVAGPGKEGDAVTRNANARAWVGAGLGILIGVATLLAFFALAGALKVLFGVKVQGIIPYYVSCFVAQAVALAGIPRPDQDADPFEPGALRLAIVWLLVPLAGAYVLLVHLYALLIPIRGAVPNGEIGMLAGALGVVGLAAWLAAHAPDQGRPRHVRLFLRLFFPGLVLPTGLLAFAVYERVAAHGWTADRVTLALAAFCFALSIGWWVARHRFDLGTRSLLGIGCAVLLLGTVGPLSAGALTGRSQVVRLEAELAQAGVLVGGVLQVGERVLPDSVNQEVSAAVDALVEAGETWRLERWLPEVGQLSGAKYITERLGAQYIGPWDRRRAPKRQAGGGEAPSPPATSIRAALPTDRAVGLDTTGFTRVRHVVFVWSEKGMPQASPVPIPWLEAGWEDGLAIDLGGDTRYRLAPLDLLRVKPDEAGVAGFLDVSGPARRVRVHVVQLSLRQEDGAPPRLQKLKLLLLEGPPG
ncbi:DUF4153 domain-containing protein [Aerophototrophica crusticola]|uniref:DUF4153 domain-containing protein n=1 Tax=Aerophototrophica crusticola TaxID=1709002 RepID=A0A858R574_9PROT|nr:DUF4153 domain-containing protein [Rhodospirillaceae bacterium B3]